MKHVPQRRDFLKQTALSLAALSVARLESLAHVGKSLKRTRAPKKVIIIGAGLSGLAAAYELDKAGHEVVVLEARSRAGGRVQTLREPFSDGLYAEAGAISVYGNHNWSMRYIRELGVALDPVVTAANLSSLTYVRGKRVVAAPNQNVEWPLALTPEERQLGRKGMWDKYVGPVLDELGDYAAEGWPPPALQRYDRMSFAEFLRMRGASPDAVALLRLGYTDLLGEGIDQTSALELLREASHRRDAHEVYTIRGGSDVFPRTLAARLADKIRYGTPVVRIEHDANGVRVVTEQAGARNTLSADYLVCAIPFTLLRRVEISPRFSAAKQNAIEQLLYTSVTRVYLQTHRRFWLDEGLGGNATTDLPVMGVYHSTFSQPAARRGILESYTVGTQARRLAGMSEAERVRTTLEGMLKVYPSIRESFEGGTSKCWDEDPWARGAYAWFRPGQMTMLMPHVKRAEGRVHFAGEHTSPWPGWMQGALESGNRAAREING